MYKRIADLSQSVISLRISYILLILMFICTHIWSPYSSYRRIAHWLMFTFTLIPTLNHVFTNIFFCMAVSLKPSSDLCVSTCTVPDGVVPDKVVCTEHGVLDSVVLQYKSRITLYHDLRPHSGTLCTQWPVLWMVQTWTRPHWSTDVLIVIKYSRWEL